MDTKRVGWAWGVPPSEQPASCWIVEMCGDNWDYCDELVVYGPRPTSLEVALFGRVHRGVPMGMRRLWARNILAGETRQDAWRRVIQRRTTMRAAEMSATWERLGCAEVTP